MQRTKGIEGKEEGQDKLRNIYSTKDIKKKRRPPPHFFLETAESSLSDSPKEQDNKCFIPYEIPFCHIISLASQHVTPQGIGCCGTN